MENRQEDEYACPSFNSYSSNSLAEIAVKVVAENSAWNRNNEEDFEFSLVREDGEVLTDELFCDGQIGPVFPVFNRDLLLTNDGKSSESSKNKRLESTNKVPLSKLFLENRENHELDNPPSCSSSEDEELANIPAGTYCVWRPKAADQPSPSRCKKSNSTGSASKRWKLRDLLRRCNSEGQDSFVFLSPKNREEKLSITVPKKIKGKEAGNSSSSGGAAGSPSAHEVLYARNRAMREVDKKKSYLPYRQDLVGLFVFSSLGKSFPRF